MRARRWIAVAAMLGVLVHALALVRHHGIMMALDAQLAEQALVDSGLLCLGDHAAPDAGVPGSPKPSDAKSSCPICAGHAPAFAVAPAGRQATPVRFVAMAQWCEPERSNPALRHAVCPPPRGPPASTLSA